MIEETINLVEFLTRHGVRDHAARVAFRDLQLGYAQLNPHTVIRTAIGPHDGDAVRFGYACIDGTGLMCDYDPCRDVLSINIHAGKHAALGDDDSDE